MTKTRGSGPPPQNTPEDVLRRRRLAEERVAEIVATMPPKAQRFHNDLKDDLRAERDSLKRIVKTLHDDYKQSRSWWQPRGERPRVDFVPSLPSRSTGGGGGGDKDPGPPWLVVPWWRKGLLGLELKGPTSNSEAVTFGLWVLLLALIVLNILVMLSEGRRYSAWARGNSTGRATFMDDWYYITIPVPDVVGICWESLKGLFGF